MARPPLLLLVVVVGLGIAMGSMVDLHKRIIRGQVCRPDERLYHVQLEIFNGTHYFTCGGSLIRPEWILTATHCVENAVTITAALGVHPVRAQATIVQITEDPVIYPGTNGRNHDIALLRLTNPAPAGIPTVALPNCQNRLRIGDRVQAAGHAAHTTLDDNRRDPKGFSAELRCAEFEVVACQRIRQILQHPRNQHHRHKLHEHWLCAQDPQRSVDICSGDSGGGVVDTATTSLYGVISFTGDGDYACSEAFAFMDVCEYMDWITGEIGPPPRPPRRPPIPPRHGRSGPPPLPPRRGQPRQPSRSPGRGRSGSPPRRGRSGPRPPSPGGAQPRPPSRPPRRGRSGPRPPSPGGAQPRPPSRPPRRGRSGSRPPTRGGAQPRHPSRPPRRGRSGSRPPSRGGARPRPPSRSPSRGRSKRKGWCWNCAG